MRLCRFGFFHFFSFLCELTHQNYYILKENYFVCHLVWCKINNNESFPEFDYKIKTKWARDLNVNINVIWSKTEKSIISSQYNLCVHWMYAHSKNKTDLVMSSSKIVHSSGRRKKETQELWVDLCRVLNELRWYTIFNTYSGSIHSKMTNKLSYKW